MYKYNQYAQRHYKYRLEDIDMSSPMFDESLHDNDLNFSKPYPSHICMYCECFFESRNKLFHHLGFMNIDIGRDKKYYQNQKSHKRKFSIIKRKPLKQLNLYKSRDCDDVASLTGMIAKKLKL